MNIDLGGMLLDAVLGLPEYFGAMFAENPGPWLGVAGVLTGVALLAALSRRTRRRRR